MHFSQYQPTEKIPESRKILLRGKEIYLFKELASTNETARIIAKSGAPEGTIVVSESQTSGRGRMSRKWTCPAGKGILMSMILRPRIKPRDIPQLTLLSAVAVVNTIKQITDCKAGIKWPNDILIKGKKVCGILAESALSSNYPEYVILGIGLNVNQGINDLPPDCRDTSTSLLLESKSYVPRVKALWQLIGDWEEHYQAFIKYGHSYVREKWIQSNITLQREVVIHKGNESIKGWAIDISKLGGLMVKLENGETMEVMADDVSLGRGFYKNLIK